MTTPLAQALQQRHSTRAFTAQMPSAQCVRDLLQAAAHAPSAGNLQPWRAVVLAGAPLEALKDEAAQGEEGIARAPSYPENLWEPYRTRRFAAGEALYNQLGIAREDKAGRARQGAQNARMFGAPVGIFLFVDERMGAAQWLDMGIYLQTLMLLADDAGLATCAQGFWRRRESLLRRHITAEMVPAHYQIAVGVALGYEDRSAPINGTRTARAAFGEWAQMHGF